MTEVSFDTSLMDETPFSKLRFLASHAAQGKSAGVPFDMENPDVALFLATHTVLKVKQGVLWVDWEMFGEDLSVENPAYKENREDIYLKVCRILDRKPKMERPSRKKSWVVPTFKDATKDLDLSELPVGLSPVEKVKWVYENLGVIRHKDALTTKATRKPKQGVLPEKLNEFKTVLLSLPGRQRLSLLDTLVRSCKATYKITTNMARPESFCECRDKLWNKFKVSLPVSGLIKFKEQEFALYTLFGASVCLDELHGNYSNDGHDLGTETYSIYDNISLLEFLVEHIVDDSNKANITFNHDELIPVSRCFGKAYKSLLVGDTTLDRLSFPNIYGLHTPLDFCMLILDNWKNSATDEVKEFLENEDNFYPYHLYQRNKAYPIEINYNAIAISLYEHTGKLLSPITIQFAVEKGKLQTLAKGIEVCSSSI